MFMLLFVFAFHLPTCHNAVDIEYSDKVVSDHKGDGFGRSLATSHHKLVIGAPSDNKWRGSVVVDEGVRVKGPADGRDFGRYVDVNQQFMVVSGRQPDSVYVHQSYSPYDMVARIAIDDWMYSLVISDDNTIAVSHYYCDNNHANWLTIYHYDGSSTWSVIKKFKLEDFGALAVYGDVLVVGVPYASRPIGLVYIFNRVGGEWKQGQTIKQDGVERFGLSVSS